MNREAADKVWDVLVTELGVYDDEKGHARDMFTWAQTRTEPCTEYRIGGKLGFGGKFRDTRNKWYVDCYVEDLTPERKRLIDATNVRLAELRATHGRRAFPGAVPIECEMADCPGCHRCLLSED